MLLTYKKAQELLQAHMAIDGNVVMNEGSGEVRIKVAHNIKQLRSASDTALETRQKVVREMTDGKGVDPADKVLDQQIGLRIIEIDNTEVELKLWRIPYAKLNPDNVSPKILAALGDDLIKDMPELGEPDA